MTQEEIIEYNKLCVEEALGLKCSVNGQYELPKMMIFPPKKGSNLCYTAKVCCVEDMQFHSDWNWIMDVVDAIEKKSWVNIKGCAVDISTIANLNAPTKKEAVVEAINQFLIWYEQNKKK